jgi:hypothetical protein
MDGSVMETTGGWMFSVFHDLQVRDNDLDLEYD